jgi:hypothetical protein
MMMDLYGFRIISAVDQVRKLKTMIELVLMEDPDSISPSYGGDPPNFSTLALNIVHSLAEELQLESTKLQISRLIRHAFLKLPASDFLDELVQLLVRIEEDLRKRNFVFVGP